MTYKEHYEQLSFEYDQASKEFHKFKGRLSKTRRHKSGRQSKYSIAKHRFEETSKSYWAFINFWVSHQLDPMDEVGINDLLRKVYSPEAGKWVEAPGLHVLN